MAHYGMTRTYSAGSPLLGRLNSVLTAVLAWNDARMTRKALNSLTTRELDDIGLVRGNIDAIAEHRIR